jgi:hypothetical protein
VSAPKQPISNSSDASRPRKPGLGYEGRLHYTNRCTARRQRDGKPCGAWAIRGATVCRIHGGMAPQVQAKAKQRLESTSDYVAQAVAKALRDKGVKADGLGLPAPWGERLKAALDVATGNIPMADEKPEPEHTESPPDSTGEAPEPAEQPDLHEHMAGKPTRPPRPQLGTLEDANADIAQANRAANLAARRKRAGGRPRVR